MASTQLVLDTVEVVLRVLNLVKVTSSKWYPVEHSHGLRSLQEHDDDVEGDEEVAVATEEQPAAAIARAAKEALLALQRLQTNY